MGNQKDFKWGHDMSRAILGEDHFGSILKRLEEKRLEVAEEGQTRGSPDLTFFSGSSAP